MTQIPVVILYLILAIIIVLLVVLVVRAVIKRLPHELPMDEMEGHDFEYYCADLLKANGFLEVEVTKGSGDFWLRKTVLPMLFSASAMISQSVSRQSRRSMQAVITMTEWSV